MHVFDSWLKQAQVGQSRSSVLNPLQWGLVILIGGVVLAHFASVEPWITSSLAISALLDVFLFVVAYIYFMFKNPDALRSESYSLSKLAIERGLVGDSLSGIVDANQPMLQAPSVDAEQEARR